MIKHIPLALALLFTACAPVSQADPTPSSGATTVQDNLIDIRANLDGWLRAFNAKDIDALMALYDPASSYAGGSGPYLTNLDDIRARYAAGFGNINATLLFREEKAIAGTDMGLIVGQFYFKPLDAEAETGPTGRVALVYRKQDDSSWKLLFDMDNAPGDIDPADFQ